MGSRKLVAFVHIEKAAGTSLIDIFRRNFPFRYMDVRPIYPGDHRHLKNKDLDGLQRINPFLRYIGGHSISPYQGLSSANREIRFVTLFRDPIERYISQYVFWHRKLGHRLTFEEFLDRNDTRNIQTRKIAGGEDPNEALAILRERFLLAGVVERLDEFLLLLQERLKPWSFQPEFVRKNTAPDRSRSSELLEKYEDRIRECNAADIILYEAVQHELLPEYINTYGQDFERDLAGLHSDGIMNRRAIWMGRVNFLVRNLYCKPVVGFWRLGNGLPYKGSYTNY